MGTHRGTWSAPAAPTGWKVTANVSAIDSIKAMVYKDPAKAVKVGWPSHFPGVSELGHEGLHTWPIGSCCPWYITAPTRVAIC